MDENLLARFEGLNRLPQDVRRTLVERSRLVHLSEGATVFGAGRVPENLLLLVSGTVRVQQSSESGREIVLYRIEAGQSCVLTTACLLAHQAYNAEGIAETDVEAIAIPKPVFDDLLARSQAFRDFVFVAYSQRITDLFRVIDEVAFGRIDVRLAERLLQLSRGGRQVQATHLQLASELGTAREVVSRQLTDFQRRGLIEQARGRITLVDLPALQRISETIPA